MTQKGVVAKALLLLFVVGCESGPPPPSGYGEKPPREHEVAGRVWRGTAPVPGAFVRIARSKGAGFDPTLEDAGPPDAAPPFTSASTITNPGGFFRFLDASPTYDLFARTDREVVVRERLVKRFHDPSFEGAAPVPAWRAGIDPVVQGARPGHSLRFYASGERVYSVAGDPANGLTVAIGMFSARVTLHAIEIPDGADGTAAVAYAKTDVDVRAETRSVATLVLIPIDRTEPVTFRMKGGAGLVPGLAEVMFDFGVFENRVVVARVPLGVERRMAVVPNAGLVVRLRASANDAESDSGHVFFGYTPVVEIPVPEVLPELGTPAQGEGLEVNGVLTSPSTGVLEHVLEPLDPTGVAIKIGSSSGSATIPDMTTLGLPHVQGFYRWSVRSFPALEFIDGLTGPFVHVFPSARSAGRTIVLR